MKKILLSAAVVSAMFVLSCGNNSSHESHDATAEATADSEHAIANEEKEVPVVAVSFTDLDGKVSASIKAMTDGYLDVKNALVEGNAANAAKAAGNISAALKGLDKSLLTAAQKPVYDAAETAISSAATAIAGAATDLAAQRTQFYSLSLSMYQLVKSFGGGRPLYHDHCPMARDNQGALWISETKEIKNPYFGDEMLTCGTVEEVIQ